MRVHILKMKLEKIINILNFESCKYCIAPSHFGLAPLPDTKTLLRPWTSMIINQFVPPQIFCSRTAPMYSTCTVLCMYCTHIIIQMLLNNLIISSFEITDCHKLLFKNL